MLEPVMIDEKLLTNVVNSISKDHESGELYLILGVLMSISPFLWKIVKKFLVSQKNEFKEEIKEDIKEDHEDFKQIMRDQMQTVKDTVDVVKKHSEISQKQHEDNQNIMIIHIEELRHLHDKVDNHDKRIRKNTFDLNQIKNT